MIIRLALGIFAFYMGFSFLSNYFGGNEEKLAELVSLKENGEQALGIFDSMYTETTRKGRSTYSVGYTYTVDSRAL